MGFYLIARGVASCLRHFSATHELRDVMTDRDKKSAPDHDDEPMDGNDSIIPGRHGKHGGSPESEGAPQEKSREETRPPKHNGDDHNRH